MNRFLAIALVAFLAGLGSQAINDIVGSPLPVPVPGMLAGLVIGLVAGLAEGKP